MPNKNIINNYIDDILKKECEHLEMFCAAYYKHTNICPSEAVLVRETKGNKIYWWFEEKKKFEERYGKI